MTHTTPRFDSRTSAYDLSVFVAQIAVCGRVVKLSPNASAAYALELRTIATKLHRISENQCNGYQTHDFKPDHARENKDERAEKRLAARLHAVAEVFGFYVVMQGDPRGCAVQLYTKSTASGIHGTIYVPQRAR